MFFFEPDKCLKITRGDTGIIRIRVTEDDAEFTDYTATLSIKKNYSDNEYVIQKEADSGIFDFTHADTENLVPGKYVMDVEFRAGTTVATLGVWDAFVLKDVTRG